MSWSVNLIGTPEGVQKGLDAYTDKLTGQSKDEYVEALPHLKGLVAQNMGGLNVKLDASGHATVTNGTKTYGNCSVTLTQFYGEFLT